MKKKSTHCRGKLGLTLAACCMVLAGNANPISGLLIDKHVHVIEFHPEGGIKVDIPDKDLGSSILQAARIVSGEVLDENGGGLPGVTVQIKGTSIGVVTDLQGSYRIDVPDEHENGTLLFSFVGYLPQEVPINNQSTINIELVPDVKSLEEVVVIGYQTVQKKDLTGAVSVVDGEELNKMQTTTVAEALQGRAAGVNVRNSGRAGAESSINIRGIGNFSNNQPLYVIDGVPTNATRDFNPNDVASIQILKDASAAAIYGSRAANGVIIIETKKGKEGPMEIDFSGRYGVQTLPRYEFMSADEYIKYTDMAYLEGGFELQQHDTSVDTDWQEETFKTAQTHDYNLSFSGGNEFGTYLVSGNYFGNSGTSFGSSFERYSFRVNTEGRKGIFKIGENLSISNAYSDDLITNPFNDVLRMLPTIPVYDEANPGGFGYGDEGNARTFGTNPIARESLELTSNENVRLRGNAYAELEFFDFLRYRLNVGLETSSEEYKYLRKVGNFTLNQPYFPSQVSENRGRYLSTLIENTLNFDKSFGSHTIDGVVGTTFQRQSYEQISGTIANLVEAGGNYYDNLGAGKSNPATGGFIVEDALISYLGRINYSFNEKYYLSGTVRMDGSSRFAEENRWGTFPSISAAWRISEENFFDIPGVDDVKLRANYGTLGNSSIGRSIGYGGSFYGSAVYNIGNWDYMNLLNPTIIAIMGEDQRVVNAATQVQLANRDIKWETQTQTNIGADLAFLNSRLELAVEYFISTTEDVLTQMPILITTGNDGGNPFANAASIRNSGFEFSASWRDVVGGLSYDVSANLSTLKNEVLDLGYGNEEVLTWITKTEIGEPIGMFYLRKTNGLFRTEEEVLTYTNSEGKVIQPDAQPGDIRFEDFNDDGQINDADRQIVGNPWPKFDLGLNFNVAYKNFDLSSSWYGAFGHTVYNGARSWVERYDDNSNHFRFEEGNEPFQENPNSDFPRLLYGDIRNSRGDLDRWLENGSYFRMRNVMFGYTLPRPLLESVGIGTARIFVSGQNLITLTKYTGLDPDFPAPEIWRQGHDEVSYPNARAFLVGLNFNF